MKQKFEVKDQTYEWTPAELLGLLEDFQRSGKEPLAFLVSLGYRAGIISEVKENPEAAYYVISDFDSPNEIKFTLSDAISTKGRCLDAFDKTGKYLESYQWNEDFSIYEKTE